MTTLDTNKLLEVLKTNPDIRLEFIKSFASCKDIDAAFTEAMKVAPIDYPKTIKELYITFMPYLDTMDIELCEKIIAQALDEGDARVQQHMVNEFIAQYA